MISDFLNNPWVSGIITGLIVYFVTEGIRRFREKKQYLQKVELTNKEIFNILKTSIPEQVLPGPKILKSIHRSTAKYYNVKIDDVDSIPVIFDDLIKEIMESNFLSYENKLVYCERLIDLKKDVQTHEKEESEEQPQIKENVRLTFSSLGISAVGATLASGAAMILGEEKLQMELNKIFTDPINPVRSFILVVATLSVLVLIDSKLKQLMKKKKKSIPKLDDEKSEKSA